MTTNHELIKLLFDPKAEAILQSVKKRDKTVKEIAAELNEKSSRLYYPVQKLLTTGLIRVTKEKQTGNLIEKYFSSSHLFDEDDVLHLEGELASKNAEYIFPRVLMSVSKGLDLMQADFDDFENGIRSAKSRAMYSEIDVQLTNEEWQRVSEEIRRILSDRETSDRAGSQAYTFAIMTYEKDEAPEE